jgi:hypothetical protein
LRTLGQFFRVAEIIGTDRTSTAVFAKMLGRADQLDKFLGIGFYKPLFLEGAQSFLARITHRLLLSDLWFASSGRHGSCTERTGILLDIHSSVAVKFADSVWHGGCSARLGKKLFLISSKSVSAMDEVFFTRADCEHQIDRAWVCCIKKKLSAP